MLELDALRRFDDLEIRLALQAGAGITCIFGPSGSGKTTLLNMICGLEKPDSGSITLNGRPLFDHAKGINVSVSKRRTGLVPQRAALFPHMNVVKNLEYAVRHGGRTSDLDTFKVAEWLGISDLLHRKPGSLSGGERQRISLGRALLSGPEILLLDEPLSAVDVGKKQDILDLVERIRDQFDIPILYVTHSLDELVRLANDVVVLESGMVRLSGHVEDVLPTGSVVAEFPAQAILSGKVVSPATIADAKRHEERLLNEIQIEDQSVLVPGNVLPTGRKVRLRIDPRDVIIATEHLAGVSALNQLSGVIESIIHLDGDQQNLVMVEGRVANQRMLARITRRSLEEMRLETGQPVHFVIKTVALMGQA